MTTTAQPLPPPAPTSPEAAATAPRSWVGGVLLRTVGRTGAMIGLGWIGIVAFCAVFAPLLANSRPILMRMDGRWSSPMVQHLNWADVTLLVLALAVVMLLPARRLTVPKRLLAILAVSAVTLLLSLILVRPAPMTGGFEQWRELRTAGEIDWALWAPIRFSPTDRLADKFDLEMPHPWAPSWAYHLGTEWRSERPVPGFLAHPLGTDRNSTDILSQIIHACRIALAIGFIATGIAAVIGVIIGGIMGYFSGIADLIGMRLVEIFGSIPTIYLLLAFVAFFGRDLYLMMVIIGLVSWTGDARFIRAEFLKLRGQDFVQAAVASGLPLWRVLYRHILPNAMAPLLVSASFGVASAILFESTLSFLGLGLIDQPSWGSLLNQAVAAGGGFYWWLAVFPGLLIFLTVFAYNLVGEAVRDALDPRVLAGSNE